MQQFSLASPSPTTNDILISQQDFTRTWSMNLRLQHVMTDDGNTVHMDILVTYCGSITEQSKLGRDLII